MNIKKLMYTLSLALFIVQGSIAADAVKVEAEGGFWNGCVKGLNEVTCLCIKLKNFFVESGEGKQALKQVETMQSTVNASTKLAEVTVATAQVANSLAEPMKKMAENLDGVKENTSKIHGMLQKFVESNRDGKYDKHIATFSGICAVGTIGYGLYSGYRYFRPSEADVTREELARQKLKKSKSKMALNECLVRNFQARKNEDGLPCACNDTAEMYASVAGYDKLQKIVKAFKEVKL